MFLSQGAWILVFHGCGQLRWQEGESERGSEGEKLTQRAKNKTKTLDKRDHR